MPDYGKHFQDVFNKGIGGARGRPIAVPSYKPSPYRPEEIIRRTAQKVASGTVNLSTGPENFIEDVFGESAIGGGTTGEAFLRASMERATEKRQRQFTKEIDKNIREMEVEETKRLGEAVEQQKLAGLMDAFDKPSNPLDWAGEELKERLKYLDRPMQAVSGVFMEGVEREEGKKDKLDIPGAFGGAWAGLTGQKHWDFGKDVVEEYIPDAPHPVKVAAGVAGNVFLDPLNLVGFGTAKYATRTGKLLNESKLADEIMEATSKALIDSGVSTGRRTARTVARDLGQDALERTKRIILDIKGGGVRNRVNVGSRAQLATSQATQSAEKFRKIRFAKLDGFVETFKRHVTSTLNNGPKILGDPAIAAARADDPFVDAFMTEIDKLSGRVTQSGWDKAIRDAQDVVRRSLDKDVQTLQEHIIRNVEGSYKHGVAMRIGGKQIKIPYVGKALGLTEKAVAKNLDVDAIRELSHAGQFPGKLGLLIQRGRSIGTEHLEGFRDDVAKFAQDYDKAQRREILAAIDSHRVFAHDPHLQRGLDFVQQKLDEIWDREVDFGARDPSKTPKLRDYVFVWNKKGNSKVLETFKAKRKAQIAQGKGAANFKIADAKAQGLAPVEDAFDMLIRRQMKSNRDITRALFRSDLLENYGLVARGLNDATINTRGLQSISNTKIAANLRAHADEAAGDSWYLPKEHAKVLDNFDDLSKVTTDPRFVRVVRKVTNFFKASATVYNPGYHTRNMISDFIMGVFDGIPIKTYWDLMSPRVTSFKRARDANGNYIEKIPRFHPRTGATIKIGKGWTVTADELWSMFKHNAAGGGFISSDIGHTNIAHRAVTKANEGVRRASELREDFGRVAHFLGALRQEYRGAGKGLRGADAAQLKAIEQAVYRVNHYKFDYGALTKWEQRYIKPVVPFYTFTRKAFPTVIENYMMNPKWIHRQQLMSPDGDDNKNFDTFGLPPFMKEVGYATLKDEEEPWLMSYGGTPFSVPGGVIPGKKSVNEFAQTFASQLNPLIQMPFELQQGKEIFSGEKIDSYGDYIKGKFGGPYAAFEKAQKASSRGVPLWQNIATSRVGLGLPAYKISKEQQEFNQKEWEDLNIEGAPSAPFDKFNEGEGLEKGVSIYTSKSKSTGMSSYKVRDTKTGRQLYQGTNPFDALKFAQASRGTPGLSAPLDDWNESIGKANNLKIYWSERKGGSSYRVRNTKTNDVIGDFKDVNQAFEVAQNRAAGG